MEKNESKTVGSGFPEGLSQLESLLETAKRELDDLNGIKAELEARVDNGSERAQRMLQDDEEGSLSRRIAAKEAEIGRIRSAIFNFQRNAEVQVAAAAPPDEDYR